MKKALRSVSIWLILCAVVGGMLWRDWQSGRVVAKDRFSADGSSHSKLKCTIRKYPKSSIPFASEGYYYGCEVRSHFVLLSASAYNWDGDTADICSVRIVSDHEAVFTVGDHRIRWTGSAWQGSAWDLLQ